MNLLLLKRVQQFLNIHPFGDDGRFMNHRPQVEGLSTHLLAHKVFKMQDAHNMIEVALVYREACVWRVDNVFQQLLFAAGH